MGNEIMKKAGGGNDSPFERIKRTNNSGGEYWSSRDFSQILGYTDYRNFEQVIKKAKTACFNSGHRIEDHFVDITDMIEIGKGRQRPIGHTEKLAGLRSSQQVGAKIRKTIAEQLS